MIAWRVVTLVAVTATISVPLTAQSLLQKLLRIAGLTAAPSQLRGPGDDAASGNIWVANLDRQTTQALTNDGGYRSPVFSPADRSIYALKGDAIVRIRTDGTSSSAVKAPGAIKLVGFDGQNPDELVVLLDAGAGQSPLAIVSLKSGAVTPLPYDPKAEDQRRMLAQIRAQDRVYGETTVYTKTESKQGLSRKIEWTDVYLQRGKMPPQNVSACDGVSCVQPSLSPDGRAVAFVRAGT